MNEERIYKQLDGMADQMTAMAETITDIRVDQAKLNPLITSNEQRITKLEDQAGTIQNKMAWLLGALSVTWLGFKEFFSGP